MNKSEREARPQEQSEALYASIGRFVVRFEWVCEQMTSCIIFVLHGDGLRTQNLAWALLADLNANALLQSFRAVVAELRKDHAGDMLILEKVSTSVEALIKQRNDVIHRTWFIGWGSGQEVDSWKFKKTKAGAKYKPRKGSVDEFNTLSNEADELAKIISLISAYLMLNEPFSNGLKVEGDGTIRILKKE
jgi:UDP-2,3-diacylglucosamine pyrophosphatase LpxH